MLCVLAETYALQTNLMRKDDDVYALQTNLMPKDNEVYALPNESYAPPGQKQGFVTITR